MRRRIVARQRRRQICAVSSRAAGARHLRRPAPDQTPEANASRFGRARLRWRILRRKRRAEIGRSAAVRGSRDADRPRVAGGAGRLHSLLSVRGTGDDRRIYRRGFTDFSREGIFTLGSLPLWGNSKFYLRGKSLPGVSPKPLFGLILDSTAYVLNRHSRVPGM